MNLGTIYGKFDKLDRDIIVGIMHWSRFSSDTTKSGSVVVPNYLLTSNRVIFLDSVFVSEVLRYYMTYLNSSGPGIINIPESVPSEMVYIRKIKRIIKLVDGLL